ncbi:type VI secretion system baseplate subunit TssE [Escherichia coli]|nr:type VI secretion system baseplate subunit TssE [Escherichia coli]
MRSIRRNLRQVLNTRSGSCYGSPELGITDLNDESLASSDFRREIRKSISQCIYITNLVLPMLLLRLQHRMNTPLWNYVFILWLRSMSAKPGSV